MWLPTRASIITIKRRKFHRQDSEICQFEARRALQVLAARFLQFNLLIDMKNLLILLSCWLFAISTARAAKVETKLVFAPASGLVAAPEMPQRSEISLNGRWQFQPVPIPPGFKFDTGTPPDLPLPQDAKWEATPIKIPSPWNVNTWGNGRDAGAGSNRPYHADSVYFPSYPAAWDSVQMGWMKRSFNVPAAWQNRRLILHFEAVAGEAQIWLNGRKIGEHFDSFLPFEFDVTDAMKSGANELLVGVRKSTLFDVLSADYPANQRRTYPNGSFMDNLGAASGRTCRCWLSRTCV